MSASREMSAEEILADIDMVPDWARTAVERAVKAEVRRLRMAAQAVLDWTEKERWGGPHDWLNEVLHGSTGASSETASSGSGSTSETVDPNGTQSDPFRPDTYHLRISVETHIARGEMLGKYHHRVVLDLINALDAAEPLRAVADAAAALVDELDPDAHPLSDHYQSQAEARLRAALDRWQS